VTSNAATGLPVQFFPTVSVTVTSLAAYTGFQQTVGTPGYYVNATNPQAASVVSGGLLANETFINGVPVAAINGADAPSIQASAIAAINAVTALSGVTASSSSGNKVTLTAPTDISVTFKDIAGAAIGSGMAFGTPYTGLSANITTPIAKQAVFNDDAVRITAITTNSTTYFASGRRDDQNPRTVTFRDSILSPIGGTTTEPLFDISGAPVSTGATVAYSPVTLFASDATTVSISNTFMVYTKSGVSSGISGNALAMGEASAIVTTGTFFTTTGITGTTLFNYVPGKDGQSWSFAGYTPGITTDGSATDGLCFATIRSSQGNVGAYASPGYYFNLTQNKVYRVRINVGAKASTDMVAGDVPFWDFVVDNYTAGGGDGKYIIDFMNIDHNGGAGGGPNAGSPNSLANKSQFDIWFAPPQINSASWNNGADYTDDSHSGNPYHDSGEFAAPHATANGFRFQFRLLDTNTVKGFANDFGTVCFKSFNVVSVPYSTLSTNTTMWSGTATSSGQMWYNASGGITNAQDSSTNLTIMTQTTTTATLLPNVGNTRSPFNGISAWNDNVIQVYPGFVAASVGLTDFDGLVLTGGQFNNVDELYAQWPVPWISNQLLKGSAVLTAPSAMAANYPVDAIVLGFDSPTNEILQDNYAVYSSTGNPTGMPAFGSDTEYVGFFYTHKTSNYTNATIAKSGSAGDKDPNAAQRLRLKLTIVNSPNVFSGGRFTAEKSGVMVKSMKVQVVSIPINLQ
jgi:hypothetical protein